MNDKLKKIFSLNITTRNYDPAQDDFIGSLYIVSLLLANADTGEFIGGHIYRVEGCNSPENIGNDYPFGESMEDEFWNIYSELCLINVESEDNDNCPPVLGLNPNVDVIISGNSDLESELFRRCVAKSAFRVFQMPKAIHNVSSMLLLSENNNAVYNYLNKYNLNQLLDDTEDNIENVLNVRIFRHLKNRFTQAA